MLPDGKPSTARSLVESVIDRICCQRRRFVVQILNAGLPAEFDAVSPDGGRARPRENKRDNEYSNGGQAPPCR